MAKVIILCGLPGSGKSSVSKELIKKEDNAIIICRDDLRSMVCQNYADYKHIAIKESLIKSMAVSCMEAALERDYVVIIDETNITKKMRTYWKNMATCIGERKGFEVSFMGIWVNTPIEMCKARRTADNKGTNDNWAAIIENMSHGFQEPTADEFDVFNVVGGNNG